ncbi:AAA family ATPase [candidate division KSB1 bacterium]|nr:AAA family ATPase [candidate division KSB1 bacterium]
MKAIFIAATGQDVGKTTTSIGLFHLFQNMGIKTGFMKPVGQSFVEIDEIQADKDALLFKVVFDMPDELKWMSPVIIPPGFTSEYINNREKYGHLERDIVTAFRQISQDKDVVIAEGTGHAGVGSVIGLSNAKVAKLIGASAVIVGQGGIGNSIDQIMLNVAMFEREGAEICGVVVNKVKESKYEKIKHIVSEDLVYKNLCPLGFLPYQPLLSLPHIYQIKKRVGADVLSGEKNMHDFVENVIIADMAPHNMLDNIKNHSLVITPGDRVDNILVTISCYFLEQNRQTKISGLLLTGNALPNESILKLLKNTGIPVLHCPDDSYTVASKVFSLTVKTQTSDLSKLEIIKSLYAEYIDKQKLCEQIGIPVPVL